uniref:LIM/homeobox protein Awh n=1 Tax=Panagrolaimus sp. JU765 TaxID=591449 RepID=A0AC34R1L6_9BILA
MGTGPNLNPSHPTFMGFPLDGTVPEMPIMSHSTYLAPLGEQKLPMLQMKHEDAAFCQKENLGEPMEASTSEIGPFHGCFGCHEPISDKWLLAVNNTHWHTGCLQCSGCSAALGEAPTCFWREGRVYCRNCYQTQFVEAKCASCQRSIGPKDWVRRAREFVYHLACFACSHCKRQLSTGEEFSINDNRLLCKQHYMELIHGHCKTKTKRVRTTFAEEQLSVLQAHFQIDSNPDGADLEKIANITGLSKRVTQVWFQNSRARQKKYQGNKKARTGNGSGSEHCGSIANTSGRSSTATRSPSPSGSCEGMLFPTSVTTSAEEVESKMLIENLGGYND